MGPIPVKKRQPAIRRELSNLHDPEMTLTLTELAHETTVTDRGRASSASVMSSPDWLSELNSAACLVLDREEREALARELERITRSHPIAA